MSRLWLSLLESADPVFAALQRAEFLSPPEDWSVLAFAHQQAMTEAAWGADLNVMEQRARDRQVLAGRMAERDDDGSDAGHVHAAELEALGYALGLTAATAAIRVHDQAQAGLGVAS